MFIHKNTRQTKPYDAYKAQRGWQGLSCVASLFVSLSLPQRISPPNGENKTFHFKHRTDWKASICCLRKSMAHLANIEGVMVEAFDEEHNSRWWELVVISQQQ